MKSVFAILIFGAFLVGCDVAKDLLTVHSCMTSLGGGTYQCQEFVYGHSEEDARAVCGSGTFQESTHCQQSYEGISSWGKCVVDDITAKSYFRFYEASLSTAVNKCNSMSGTWELDQ